MGTADKRWDRRQKVARVRRELRERALLYKGGECTICKYDKCMSAMEFHHLDPREKDFSISDKMTSWERIKSELDKCVLVCANCHREIHDGFHPGYIVWEDRITGGDELEPVCIDLEEPIDRL